jgi:hypothetical protein
MLGERGAMPYDAELADPLVDVRDVVETFRCCGLVPEDWQGTLAEAVVSLNALPREAQVDVRLPRLVARLRQLLTHGLDSEPQIVNEVADQVAAALEQTRIPGIPRPDEDSWEFSHPNAS